MWGIFILRFGGDLKPKTGKRYGKLRVEMSHEIGVLQI
jgi:hypothetical protein